MGDWLYLEAEATVAAGAVVAAADGGAVVAVAAGPQAVRTMDTRKSSGIRYFLTMSGSLL
jgi:hypothetical protein